MARYIIRTSFSQERMAYITANDASDSISVIIYQSKDETSTKTFEALDRLVQLVTHIPNKGSRWLVIADSTQISRVDYEKRPAQTMMCRL